MKLKTKRLLAAALAISLTANISLAAFATVTYDLTENDVTVEATEGSIYSWQGNEEDAEKSDDPDIVITTKDEDGNINETNNTVTIKGDFDEVEEDYSITIEDANIILDEDNDADAAIEIEDKTVVDNITIEDVEITVEKDGGAGIKVGDDAEADITLSGDNDIILDAGTTSGIEIGEGSDVTITVDGTTNITASDNIENDVGTGNMTVGITVGGGAYDGSSSTNSDDSDSNEPSKVVITGTADNDNVLNIKDTSVGILVHDGTELVIGDDIKDDELEERITVNISGSERTYDADDDSKDFYTVSGKGIMSYDDLTITDGATVNINDSDVIGINVIGGDLEVSGGAQVSVTDTGKSNDLDPDTDDSTTYAGIYVEKGNNISITGDNTVVTVSNVTDGKGIVYEGGEGTSFTVDDGAVVEVEETSDSGISVGHNGTMTITKNGSVSITNTATNPLIRGGLYLNPGSILIVSDDDNDGDSTLTIVKAAGSAIIAEDANIDISGLYAFVKLNNTLGAGIQMSGAEESSLIVHDYGNLEIVNQGDHSIYTSNGISNEVDSTRYSNKTIEFLSNANVTITKLDGSNAILLYGGNSSLLVDNAKLITNARLALYGSDGYTSTITINNSSRVEASVIRDYAAGTDGAGSLIVNGGTLKLTKDSTESSDLSKDDAETLKGDVNNSPYTWAVSGDENGGEELTNFKVSISYLQELQESLRVEEENKKLTDEEFFDKYGFVITSNETNMEDVTGNLVEANQLIIKTYGYSKDEDSGEVSYIDYNSNTEREDGYTTTKWYVVDLNKYCDEQGDIVDDELWIWTPAIVLSYYALNEDQEMEDAEDYSESNPEDPVTAEVATQLTVNHDVIYRGGSLIFDSFKTDETLMTIRNPEKTAYQEAMDELDKDEYSGYSGLKIYNAYTTKDGWEDFDEETIVLLAEGPNFGYKNLFAPVKTDEPTPDEPGGGSGDPEPETPPETPPTDEPGTPETEPREPEEPLEPDTPVVPVVPVTPETPAQPGETPAETPADPEAPAAPAEPATPASSTPKTGDEANVAIYLVMAALSGAALIGLGVTGKKKNEEV